MYFLDPTNDLAFKQVFGDEGKKKLLMSLLNGILELREKKTINDIVILNPYQAPQIKNSKQTIIDVQCRDQSGAEYIVEMQIFKDKDFDLRVQFYAARAYSNQISTGSGYHALKPVIFLGILAFKFSSNHQYLSNHLIRDVETNEHLLQAFRFTFVELPKFKKTEDELETITDKWIYFLKYAKDLESIPEVIKEEAIKEAFHILNRYDWNKEELELYDNIAIRKEQEARQIKEGIDQGFERGRREGKKEGRERGKKEGIALGKKEGLKEVAKRLQKQGFSTQEICKITGLKPVDVKNLSQPTTKK